MRIKYNMRLVLSGVLNVTRIVGLATSLYAMDGFGRRLILWLVILAMTFCYIVIAVLVGLYFDTWSDHKEKGWWL